MELIKGGRGDFIVKAGEAVVWNKKEEGGRFPDEEDIVEELRGLGS